MADSDDPEVVVYGLGYCAASAALEETACARLLDRLPTLEGARANLFLALLHARGSWERFDSWPRGTHAWKFDDFEPAAMRRTREVIGSATDEFALRPEDRAALRDLLTLVWYPSQLNSEGISLFRTCGAAPQRPSPTQCEALAHIIAAQTTSWSWLLAARRLSQDQAGTPEERGLRATLVQEARDTVRVGYRAGSYTAVRDGTSTYFDETFARGRIAADREALRRHPELADALLSELRAEAGSH